MRDWVSVKSPPTPPTWTLALARMRRRPRRSDGPGACGDLPKVGHRRGSLESSHATPSARRTLQQLALYVPSPIGRARLRGKGTHRPEHFYQLTVARPETAICRRECEWQRGVVSCRLAPGIGARGRSGACRPSYGRSPTTPCGQSNVRSTPVGGAPP
ncbi:hypothetical protein D9M70_500950 [compost metagenome]